MSNTVTAGGITQQFDGQVYYVHSGVTGADGSTIPQNLYGADTTIAGLNQSDSNDGLAPTRPFATLGKLQSVMAAGDIAYVAGRFYTENPTDYAFKLTTKSNVGIAHWPGQVPAQIKCSTKVATGGWSSAVGVGGATYWTKNIGSVANINRVCMDWDLAANVTADRIHKCWLPNATAAHVKDDVADVKGAWNYTDPNLVVRMPTSTANTPATPGANGVEYMRAGAVGVGFLSIDTSTPNTGILVDGLHIGPICCVATSPQGCGVVIQNGQNTIISNNGVYDYGIHGLSIGRLVTNVTSYGNWITGGDGGGTGATSCMVFNATGAGNSSTGTSNKDKVFTHPLLATDGEPMLDTGVPTAASVRFAEAHGSTQRLRFYDIQAKEYVSPAGVMSVSYGFDFRDTDTTVSNHFDPTNYPVQVIQTDPTIWTITNGSYVFPDTFNSSVSYLNCRFKYNKSNTTLYPYVYDWRVLTGVQGFFGCEFSVTLALNNCTSIFVGGDTSCEFVFVNCTVYDNGSANVSARYIFRFTGAGASTIEAYGNLFAFVVSSSGAQVCVGDGAISTGHTFVGNAYYNVPTTTYSDNPSFNTLAELDSTGVLISSNPILNTTGVTGLRLTQSERRRKLKQAVHVTRGSNQKNYAGNYGSNQEPSSSLLSLLDEPESEF